MPENRKLIFAKFQEHINTRYKYFCERHHIEPSTKTLINFLVDQNLISSVNIKHFTVTHEFEQIVQTTNTLKSKSVNALADKFNIPERTIWGILKKMGR